MSAAGGGAGVAPIVTQAQLDEAARLLRTPAIATAPTRPAAPPQAFSRAQSFHPGVTDATAAATITLAAGEERTGIDIVSRLVAVSPISGLAFGPDGQSAGAEAMIGLTSLPPGFGFSPGFVRPGPDAAFRTPPMPAGRDPSRRPTDGGKRRSELASGRDRARSDGGQWSCSAIPSRNAGARARCDACRRKCAVGLDPNSRTPAGVRRGERDAQNPAGIGRARRVFLVSESVPPGRYRIGVTGSGAWSLRTATAAGLDVLDAPMVVSAGSPIDVALAFTNQPAVLTGRLTDQLGRPAPDYGIVVFSADPKLRATSPRRSSGVVRLGTDAVFTVTGAGRAGDYLLAAITDLDPAQLTDSALLELMAASAIRIQLVEGQRTTQDIRLAS